MRILLVVVLWVVATVAATGLAFGAVAIVGDAATAPPAVLAPIDAAGDGPVEVVLEQGALAVECAADAITLVWAQPAEGSIVSIRDSGPDAVVVEFAEEDEVVMVEVRCVDGVPTSTVTEREVDEGPAATTSTTSPPTTEPDDDDDERPSTTVTSPSTTSPSPSTTTTEPDDDDDDDAVTTTTEADDPDDDPDDDDPDDDD